VGKALFADSRVRMITFTGSTQTSRQLAVEAAKTLKRFTLEGGKSPLIVLADADIDYVVKAAAFGIFFHQGQVCMANSRILVEAPIYDVFCERFVAVANSLKVGDPREPHGPHQRLHGRGRAFGGVKNSGFGREGGRFSMEEMTELKWITVQRGQRGFPI
jgi:acyl-CoA reductase-like NAD-dependent aldehyde dehydrogenase